MAPPSTEVGHIFFEPLIKGPNFSPRKEDESKPWQGQLIQWNADHSEAEVQLATVYGGLAGVGYDVRLRRYLGQWVVTSVEMAWES